MDRMTAQDSKTKNGRKRSQQSAERRVWTVPAWAAALLVAAVAAAAYVAARLGGFVWDDLILLVEWPYYRDPGLFAEALSGYLPFSPNYFRPIAALTFFANYAIHGLVAAGYHWLNVIIHALTSLLAYLLLRRLLGVSSGKGQLPPSKREKALSGWMALGLALLFALHPVHVEPVVLAVGRFDLLSTCFGLLALYLAVITDSAKKDWLRGLLAAAAGVAFLLALGSKEMAITLPLVLLAIDAYRGVNWRANWRARWPVYLAFFIAGLAYLVWRGLALGYLYLPQQVAALTVGNPLNHLLLVARSFARYLLLMVWPFGSLSPIQFSNLPVSAADPVAWLELLILVGLLAWLAIALFRRKPAAWIWLAALCSLLPVANILPLELRGGAIVAERFLYLPSFLLLTAVGVALLGLLRRAWRDGTQSGAWWVPVLAGAVSVVLLAAYVVTVVITVPRWANDTVLWQWAAGRAPSSSLPLTNLSRAALDQGNWLEALEFADRARDLDLSDPTAHNNAGSALMNLGQIDEAEESFRQAIALQPGNPLYWTNLASVLSNQGHHLEAIELIETEVLSRDPSSGPAQAVLGAAYLNSGLPQEAVAALRRAEELLPDPTVIKVDLAEALLAAGEYDEAFDMLEEGAPLSAGYWVHLGDQLATTRELEAGLAAYERALETNSVYGGLNSHDLVLLHVQRAAVYQALGQLDKAEEVAYMAMMTDQSEPLVHKLLGDLLRLRGQLGAAQKAYERAQNLAPDIAEIYFDLGDVLREQGEIEAARQQFGLYLEMAPLGSRAQEAQDYLDS
jgi:tetratricopeptide (TPR) repeat protein